MDNSQPPAEPVSERISFAKWLHLLVSTSAILLLIGLVAVVLKLAEAINHTLLLFALGALIAYALDPLVEGLRHARIFKRPGGDRAPSRGATVAMLFFVVLAALTLCLIWLGRLLTVQMQYLEAEYPYYQQRALQLAARANAMLARHHIRLNILQLIHHPPPGLQHSLAKMESDAVPLITHFFGNVGESAIVLLISLYLLLFAADMKEKLNASLPARLREYVELWETDVNRIFGGFVRGQVIIALVMGAMSAAACLIVGIHLWLIIGLIVVVCSLIPVFGPYLGAIPAVIAAIIGPTHFSSSIVAAVVVVVAFVVVNEIGSKVLYPRLVGAALGLHEVLVLFVLFAGLEIGGIVGVLFAAPVTAFGIVTIVHLYRYWQDLPDDLLSASLRREAEARTAAVPSAAGHDGRETAP